MNIIQIHSKTYHTLFVPDYPFDFISCVLLFKTKVTFLEGRPFSSQSEHFDNFSDCSDYPDKSRPSKKTAFVLNM